MASYSPSGLPSYSEATTRVDAWGIIAPYIPIRAYTSLCLVSSRLHGHFASRLWNDPLRMLKLLGLRHGYDLAWFLYRFIGRSVKIARSSTRSLVVTLDFRSLASGAASLLANEIVGAYNDTLRRLPTLFPRLRCLLLDGDPVATLKVPDLAEGQFQGQSDQPHLLLFSVSGIGHQPPASYFDSQYTRSLVYLDVSFLPGSLRTALEQGSFSPRTLPSLRVLKARGRELDDDVARTLATVFGRQLWSLDLGRNRLTSTALHQVATICLPHRSLRSSIHFPIEGKVSQMPNSSLNEYGPFIAIEESDHSANYSHPQRYFADVPSYQPRNAEAQEAYEGAAAPERADGTAPLLRDGPNDLIRYLAGGPTCDPPAPRMDDVLASRLCHGFRGLTHLSVSENRGITLPGLEKIIRMSGGVLEHLDCDLVTMRSPPAALLPKWLPQSVRICGVVGVAHLFRPVVSSNLRSLRVHHSLVTQTPMLVSQGGIPSLADVWAAEELLLPAAELAHPGLGGSGGPAFVPDMNPRLASLTLTNVPRRSTGRLLAKLTTFLGLLHEQERAIAETAAAVAGSSRRSPALLSGMRCLRLEFGPDLIGEIEGLSDEEIVGGDPAVLMDEPPGEFSFFEEWRPEEPRAGPPRGRPHLGSDEGSALSSSNLADAAPLPTRPPSGLFGAVTTADEAEGGQDGKAGTPGAAGDYVIRKVARDDGTMMEVSVWTGPGTSSDVTASPIRDRPEAVAEYARLLRAHPSLGRGGVGPATPSQVRAGAPAGQFLFQWAWEAIIWSSGERKHDVAEASTAPRATSSPCGVPTVGDLRRMRDVVAELKRFRQEGRRTGRHWTGAVEVVLRDTPVDFDA